MPYILVKRGDLETAKYDSEKGNWGDISIKARAKEIIGQLQKVGRGTQSKLDSADTFVSGFHLVAR